MPERSNGRNDSSGQVQFTSDAEFLVVREEDTRPGNKISDKYRQQLRVKYGRIASPPRKPSDEGNGA